MNYKQLYLFLLFSVAMIMAACGDKKSAQEEGPPPATPVTIIEVNSTDAAYNDEYPATLAALNEIKLTSQVSGYVTGIYFNDGQKVNKGKRLYSIDAEVYKANYQQSVADMQVQQANLLKAQKDAERYHELDNMTL
ncbi:MAG: biotin/lipoyl-binding protein [Ginsengibacter sp.]